MNAERLYLLTAELRKWPENRFNFGKWVGEDWKGKPDLSCGTSACALGIATTMPVFRALGLRLTNGKYGPYISIEGKAPVLSNNHILYEPLYIDTSLESAATIFDLTRSEAKYLFMPEESPYDIYTDYEGSGLRHSPFEEAPAIVVANHIEAFINWKLGKHESE